MIFDLVDKDHPILNTPTLWGCDVDRHELSKTLIENMRHYGGIGLAANQIGIDERCFSMDLVGRSRSIVCYNPSIVDHSTYLSVLEEGCLSFDKEFTVLVSRPNSIDVKYEDEDRKVITRSLTGLDAKVFQHELDHLDGILFTKRGTPVVI